MEIKSREELDQDWIDNYFNNINNNIFSFIEPIKEITIFFIYINNNETEYFFKSFLNIDKFISKASLFKLIEERKIINNNYYNLKNLFKYELLLDQHNIKKFLDNEKYYNELQAVNYYDDIYFSDNINIFKKINSLFFIFEKKFSKDSKNITFKTVRTKHNLTKKSFAKRV